MVLIFLSATLACARAAKKDLCFDFHVSSSRARALETAEVEVAGCDARRATGWPQCASVHGECVEESGIRSDQRNIDASYFQT